MRRAFDIDQLDVNRLLDQWRWLCGEHVTLVARNGFGDLFLQTAEGRVLRLKVGDGTLGQVAESQSSFEDSLKYSQEREVWFAERQLEAFVERGLRPNDLQCIDLRCP
jgi:hypothetical protein